MIAGIAFIAFASPLTLAASASAARADVLAFAPKPDATVTKSFTLRHELVVQTMKLEDAAGSQISQQGMAVTSEITLEVTDTYRGIESGRPVALQRLFRVAGLNVDQVIVGTTGERRPETWVGDTPLKQVSVVFAWIPAEQGYGRHYDERENLEEYLGGLREDLDLRGLLPATSPAEIAVGSSWAIEPAAFADVFGAGGEVPRSYVQGGSGFLAKPIAAGVAGPLAPVFGGELKGEVRATWKETRAEEGLRLAVIDLRVRLEAKRDQTASARASRRTEELLDEVSIARATIEWKFEGEGTLLWNLGAGRFEKLTLGGREEVANDISFGSEAETTSRQVLSLAGALRLTATAQAD